MEGTTPLLGRVIIVTGASRGIGRALALELGHRGARVMGTARDEMALEAVRRESEGQVAVLAGDITRAQDVERIVGQARRILGPVDTLVNNAGVGAYGPVHTLAEDDVDAMLGVNLKGPWLMVRAVLGEMIQRREGQILNVASVAGLTTFPGGSMYSASKWGLIALTETLREELKPHGLRVSALCTGSVQTGFGQSPPRDTALPVAAVVHVAIEILSSPPDVIWNQVVMRPRVQPRD